MAGRGRNRAFGQFGINVRGRTVQNGNMNTQTVESTFDLDNNDNVSLPAQQTTDLGIDQGNTTQQVFNPGQQGPANITNNEITVAGLQEGVGIEQIRQAQNLDAASEGILGADRIRAATTNRVSQINLQQPSVVNPNIRRYPIDKLSVAETRISNNQFKPIYDNGISVYRPEIIAITDFASIWRKGKIVAHQEILKKQNSTVGDFINVQYQAQALRRETLMKLIHRIQRRDRRTTADDSFRAVREQYIDTVKKLDDEITNYDQILSLVKLFKTALEIKKIEKNTYNHDIFLSLQDFFEKRMQYTKKQYNIFADTKLLLQLILDFKAIAENYSFSLLDLKDPDRDKDFSPVKLDRTYTLTSGFTFNITNLRSTTQNINASANNFFNHFMNSLPNSMDERIRILTVLLSKEYMVSKGLGKQDVQTSLQQTYNTNAVGSPFNNIIGEVGNTIFAKVRGINSLSSLMFVDVPGINDITVLPFESKYVDSDDQKFVYVPGSTYFIDSLLDIKNSPGGNSYNIAPYNNFASKFSNNLSAARKNIEALFDLKAPLLNPLSPINVHDAILNSLRSSISGLLNTTNIDQDQAVITAIFKLAASDNALKNMIFQFCLLAGVSGNSIAEQQKEIFSLLASELGTVKSFSRVRVAAESNPSLDQGLGILRPYIEQLARTIETRISNLLSKSPARNIARESVGEIGRLLTPNIGGRPNAPGAFNANFGGDISLVTDATRNTDVTSVQIQRGNIARTLMSVVTNRSHGSGNIIYEFMSVADKLAKAAQTQGTNSYLISDGTNRTRYNFLSQSTQLLMLFELLSAFINRYTSVAFERSNNRSVYTITVDSRLNKFIDASIDDLLRLSPLYMDQDTITTIISEVRRNNQGNNAFRVTEGGRENGDSGFSENQPNMRAFGFSDSSGNDSQAKFSSEFFNQSSEEVSNLFQRFGNQINELVNGNQEQAIAMRNISENFTKEQIEEILFRTNKYTLLKTTLGINRNKINDELTAVSNILHILHVISTVLTNYSDFIQNVINQNTMKDFIKENSIENFSLLKNPAHIQMASYILENIKQKTHTVSRDPRGENIDSNLVISDKFTKAEYNTLLALLSENRYLPESNANKTIKILSVGVPFGFSKSLADRVDISDINKNSFKEKEFDVIVVNVYRRDARFDDIVFKPQKYIFDLSLFILESNINQIHPEPEETFEKLMKRATVTDFSTIHPKEITLNSIIENPEYSFLKVVDKKLLIRNHITSFLLFEYINLLTGLRITEETFLQKEKPFRELNDKLQQIVFKYLREVKKVNIPANQSIEELLDNPRINRETKDVIRLFNFGSLMFSPNEVKSRVLEPKLFDRILHIPLDTDNFEVDIELTNSTESGRHAWKQAYVQENLRRNVGGSRVFLKERKKNDLAFEDYFVTIETAVD